MDVRTYVQTIDDVMAIKPKFLASMGYHIFLIMLLGGRGAPLSRNSNVVVPYETPIIAEQDAVIIVTK